MTTVRQNSRAALLIAAAEEVMDLTELAAISAVSVDDLRRCRAREGSLRPMEQLRLARAIACHIPALAREAKRLEGQVAAVLLFESGDTSSHRIYPRIWGFQR